MDSSAELGSLSSGVAGSNPVSGMRKKSKNVNGKPPVQRFWPESLQNINNHIGNWNNTTNS